MSSCKICGKLLAGKQTKFCSNDCKNRYHQGYPGQRLRGVRRKLELVQKLGGKCARCGYNKNLAVLSFHHKGEKKLPLDVRGLSNRRIEVILKEFEGCELLCLNCHMELHCPHLEMSSIDLDSY
jgi:hypothetical protein